MKIVVLDGYTENPGDLSWEGLEALGTLTVYDRTPGDKVIERIADAQAVYTNKTPITGETIEKCANMKFIGVLATGYNVINIKAARSANVVVSNIPSYGTDAVAQYAVALLLELCHHIGEHSDCVKAGGWSRSRSGPTMLTGASGSIPWWSLQARHLGSSALDVSVRGPQK